MRTPRSEMQSIAKTPANDGGNLVAGPDGEPFRLRSYQAEMVEESMRSNIICVMDTGSGKTHMYVYASVALGNADLC
jgi:superfamily II DNA or RNA helicase